MNARELDTLTREARWALTALLLAFLFCKLAQLTAIATWSWVWVLAPLWMPLVLAAGALATDLALARWDGWVFERKAARRVQAARRDHHGPQVEASAYARRGDGPTRTIDPHTRMAAVLTSLGVRVTWSPDLLEWRVLREADRRGFTIPLARVDRSHLDRDSALLSAIDDGLRELGPVA